MPTTVEQPPRVHPERWLRDHGDVLWRYALSGVGDPTTAEDLVQETLLAALEARDAYRGECSERTWLVSILKRRIADHWRRVRRGRARTGESRPERGDILKALYDADGRWKAPPAELAGEPECLALLQEWREKLGDCMSRLSPSLEAAVFLSSVRRLGTEQVCRLLDIAPNTLWVRLHRARLWLQRCLTEDDDPPERGEGPC